MPLSTLSLAVVGADHPNKRGPTRRFEIAVCHPGDPVELRLEPDNPADELAVAVYSERSVQLGYLTAERAPWIGKLIRQGREVRAIFQAQMRYGALIRAAFDGAVPDLPAAPERVASVDDSGFWPDEEHPIE